MFNYDDISIILGTRMCGKTSIARKLAQNLSIDYYYFDYNIMDLNYLRDFYDLNKTKRTVIIFDNYFKMNKNKLVDALFRKNTNFAIIYVMNYIDKFMLKLSDSIYIAKELNYEANKHYYNNLKQYFTNCSIAWIVNSMEDLKDYGFLCFDKELRHKKKEEYMKIKCI